MSKTKLAPLPTSKAKTAYGLLSEVCRVILAEPKRYNQGFYLFRGLSEGPACGTIGCVAGWVATLKHGKAVEWNEAGFIAERILGLSPGQSDALFSADALTTDAHVGTKAYVRAGVAHIRKFQQKYAKQLRAKAVTT